MSPTLYVFICLNAVVQVISSDGVTEVHGTVGGSVTIDCRYEQGFEHFQKYFTNIRWKLNNALIRTKNSNTLVMEGRYSLYDDTSARVFTVTIKELQMSDAGTYWCAVERTLMDDYTEVKLTLHQDHGTESPRKSTFCRRVEPALQPTP
ncbi:CMRF35-like molecule 3 isoform X2 [Erpetoichthys calabaricus]|uniref:CMRF35-like molecule 3 isoform X2 n=1 Tax=Erpetoichthys calabaricus TaxID=27687 RepID=UPI002234AB55|nr:CMRF35-like molecule 3 isoform X2 [Erpetoichthys calabaricus]